ncbi:MAG: Crp/Fnr family transcriptional regulator [Pseudomonadales bacterium]
MLLPEILSCSEVLKPGSHLFRPGDPADVQYHVRSGALKTYALNAQGDERVTGFYLPGEVLSNSQIEGRRREGAIALETATVCRLRLQDVGRLQDVAALPMLMTKLSQRETLLTEHQLNLAGTASLPRFVGFCLQYSARLAKLGRCSQHLPLPMSRTDIASYLGMTLESLSRVCAKLSKGGLLLAQPKEMQLLDRPALEALAVPGTY